MTAPDPIPADLRDALARAMYEHNHPEPRIMWPPQNPRTVALYLSRADAQLAGPLAPVLAQIADLRRQVEAKEAQRSSSAALARAFAERLTDAEAALATADARVREADARAEMAIRVIDEATKMGTLLLIPNKMTAQERRTARAIAAGLASKVRAALSPPDPSLADGARQKGAR